MQFFAGDNLAGTLDQYSQYLKRLAGEPQQNAVLAQFP
jgi:hypothetical protein